MFEVSIPPKTLMDRAYREKKKLSGNQDNPPTPPNKCDIPKNQDKHGGKREQSGGYAKITEKHINYIKSLTKTKTPINIRLSNLKEVCSCLKADRGSII
jgi:hypothetical protein